MVLSNVSETVQRWGIILFYYARICYPELLNLNEVQSLLKEWDIQSPMYLFYYTDTMTKQCMFMLLLKKTKLTDFFLYCRVIFLTFKLSRNQMSKSLFWIWLNLICHFTLYRMDLSVTWCQSLINVSCCCLLKIQINT